jgi:hypothetical protein
MPNWLRVPLLSFAALGLACGSTEVVQEGRWQYTCGDPVCHGHQPPTNVAVCTGQRSGDPCPVLDERCDPQDPCNRLLLCQEDPPPPNPCPVAPASRDATSPPGE